MINSFLFSVVSEPTLKNGIAKMINDLFGSIGNFGVTVIVFTIILKLILSPLDVWQKVAQRKQSIAMKKIQPQLDKIKKQYADRPDLFRQEQQKLFKQEKVSMLGSMLPMIISMVIFFIVFAGFNELVRYQNELLVYKVYKVYSANPSASSDLLAQTYIDGMANFKFLWIKNVFMPDSWASVIPSYKVYAGSGLGALNAGSANINIPNYYDVLVGPAMSKFPKEGAFKGWNGWLLLPILSVILTLASSKLLTPTQPPTMSMNPNDDSSKKAQNMSMKMMTYFMPVMIGVFALFYSGAFSIYMFMSSLLSTLLSLITTIIFKRIDKKKEAQALENTYR